MRFKKFELQPPPAGDSIEFELAGQRFLCRPEIPAGLLLDMALTASSRTSDTGSSIDAFLGFFQGALQDESYERFEKVIRDPQVVVSMSVLSEISGWLAETYSADRPTGGDSSVSSNSQSSGDGSTEVSLPGAVTYERYPQTEPSTSSSGG